MTVSYFLSASVKSALFSKNSWLAISRAATRSGVDLPPTFSCALDKAIKALLERICPSDKSSKTPIASPPFFSKSPRPAKNKAIALFGSTDSRALNDSSVIPAVSANSLRLGPPDLAALSVTPINLIIAVEPACAG